MANTMTFSVGELTTLARELEIANYFDRLALTRTLEMIDEALRQITAQVLSTGETGAEAITQWEQDRKGAVERTRRMLAEIAEGGELTLSKLTVGASMLTELVEHKTICS